MPEYQVEILLAAWQDIDKISWAHSTPIRNWSGWNIVKLFAESVSASTK